MKGTLNLIQLHKQVREINLQLLNGLASLVGTSFKCKRNIIVKWDDVDDVVEWKITMYDHERELFEVRCPQGLFYYVNEFALLKILDGIEG